MDNVWGPLFKGDIDRLYLKRKHGSRRLISIEISVRLEENNLFFSARGSNEMLLKGIKTVSIVKTETLMKKEDFKKNIQDDF